MINVEFITLLLFAITSWMIILIAPRVWVAVSLIPEVRDGLDQSLKDIIRALERIEVQRAILPADILTPDPYKELEESVWNHVYYTDKIASHMIYPLLFFWRPLYEIHGLPFQDRVNRHSILALEQHTDMIKQSYNVDVRPLQAELLKKKSITPS